MTETFYLEQIRDSLRGHDGTTSGVIAWLISQAIMSWLIAPTVVWYIWNHLAGARGLCLVSWWECFWGIMLVGIVLPAARKVAT